MPGFTQILPSIHRSMYRDNYLTNNAHNTLGISRKLSPSLHSCFSLRSHSTTPPKSLRHCRASDSKNQPTFSQTTLKSNTTTRIPFTALLSLGAVTGGGILGSGFDLSGPGSVLEAIVVLAAVVGVHEAGHFLAARLQNIHVTKFAIGFGPVLFKLQPEEVEYSLRLFPLGGFVSFPDDEPDSPFPIDDPNLLRNRPVKDRIIVTCAGVVANIIFAYVTCVTQAATVGILDPTYMPGIKLGNINPETVAERAGLRKGDVVLQVGDLEVAPSPESVSDVVNKIQNSPGKQLHVSLMRGEEMVSLDLTPAVMPDGTGRIGVALGPNVTVDRKKAESVGQALALGVQDFTALGGSVLKGLYQILSNFKQTAQNVSGPVAMLAVGSEVARTDVSGLYQFAALINLNLAVVNILPLPALDGTLTHVLNFKIPHDHCCLL